MLLSVMNQHFPRSFPNAFPLSETTVFRLLQRYLFDLIYLFSPLYISDRPVKFVLFFLLIIAYIHR